jgi:hypothetical protein
MTKEILDVGRGSVGILTTGRKLMVVDRPNYRRTEGGFEESNVLAKPKQEQGQTRSHLVYHMQDEGTPQE